MDPSVGPWRLAESTLNKQPGHPHSKTGGTPRNSSAAAWPFIAVPAVPPEPPTEPRANRSRDAVHAPLDAADAFATNFAAQRRASLDTADQ